MYNTGTHPPPPLKFDLIKCNKCNLFECFIILQADIKKAHSNLCKQNTLSASKVIKNILSTLETMLQQAEYFMNLLYNTRTVMNPF